MIDRRLRVAQQARRDGEAGTDAVDVRDGGKGDLLADGGTGVDTCSADKKDKKVSCP